MTAAGMTPSELLALPPTVDLPTAGRAIGIGRNQAYQLASRGEFPCRVLKLGTRYKVVTSELLELLSVGGNGRRADEASSPEGPAVVRSINALVARNLTRARGMRGLTQEELGRLLEPITGKPWSKATVSALERSAEGGRPREFDADDLVALAKVLDVPLLFLFLPDSPGRWVCRSTSGNGQSADSAGAMDAAELKSLVIGRDS